MNKNSFLTHIPPMGIYETLYAFQNSFGSYMGEKGTHPWSQGFPLTSQIPGGPEMPNSIKVNSDDLKYPKAWGQPELRQTIAEYYNHHYGSSIDLENVMIFAGGRPGLIALLMFLQPDIKTHIASTEYTPYYDMLRLMNRKYHLIDSTIDNNFHPSVNEYLAGESNQRKLVLLSNPCNPTGITRMGDELKELVERSSYDVNGLLIDEAYELFHSPPISAMQFMDDINNSNLFVAGAATKGLQSPGIRIGWVVAAKKYIEILGNFSSFGMGGVSRPSQLYALKLFDKERIELSRKAVPEFYDSQRNRYGKRFKELGLELYSGNGGFYHWCKLKGNLTGAELNEKLFKEGAAILKGTDCDMYRLEKNSHLKQFFRFSFGPLLPDSYESDIEILNNVLNK
ncbi:MAG: pyridoxal phosphate-dependent aminotransferase [Candidatus Marinimicrobia bacterium]|nr:pyridoxal phosphate-dependent aminotransferase [Candidatus Neomarinimicrobiota bacterium]